MNLLILGSHGLIGKNLSNFLKNKKYNIIDFDIKMGNDYDLRTIKGKEKLEIIIQNIDYVFFLAYDVGGSKYLQNINNISEYIENNIKIMLNVFSIIKDKPFVFASTTMYNMYDIYGNLKSIGEHLTNNSKNGLVARFYSIYDKQDYNQKSYVISDIIYMAKHDKKIKLKSDGSERRQFLHADDCSCALYNTMINHKEIINKQKCVDIASFKWSSVKDVAEIVSKIYNCDIEYSNYNDSHTKENKPDELILKYWNPSISLKEGINKLIN